MLSGRGIDGELKSKFGEWSEKFWQSGAMNGNLRAIYLTSEGGSGGDEGKSLSEMRGDNGKNLISTEAGEGEQIKSALGFCVGGGHGANGCKKNKNNASVVLVGGGEGLNASELIEGWEGWVKVEDRRGRARHEFSFDNLETFTGRGGDKGIVRFAETPQIDKLRKLFENAETVESGSFNRLQAWFCPGANGGVNNKCKNEEILKGMLPVDLTSLSFPLFVKNRVKADFFGGSVFQNKEAKLVGLLLLLELWHQGISEERIKSAVTEIQTGMKKQGLDQSLSTLKLLEYSVTSDRSSIDELRADDKAKVEEINLTQDGQNGSGSDLVIGNFGGHLGVRFGGETISSDWFDLFNDDYLRRVLNDFGLGTSVMNLLLNEKTADDRMWVLITLLFSASFDLSRELSVSVSPISKAGKVILQDLEKK